MKMDAVKTVYYIGTIIIETLADDANYIFSGRITSR